MPRKRKLLLVEDSEDDAFLFMWTFEKFGNEYEVHHQKNGGEGVDFLRDAAASESLPEFVFLDLKMPVLNGFEVLKWIREQSFSSRLKVVVVSGSSQQEDKDKARELGAVDYLVKPMQLSDFQRILGQSSGDNSKHAGNEAFF